MGETLQTVLEPGGATGLAAVLFNRVPGGIVGKTIGVVASGGNLNLEKFAKTIGCQASSGSSKTPAAVFDWTDYTTQIVPPQGPLTRPLLVVRAARGYLACGYMSTATADKLKEACGIVSGVGTPEDMLVAKLVAVSERGEKEFGLTVGMTGREALQRMSQSKLRRPVRRIVA